MIGLLLLGCRTLVGPDGPPPAQDPSEAWERVLHHAATPAGVEWDRIDPLVLDAYLGWIGKGRIPGARDGETAFWLNARTAFTLWLVLHEGRPASVSDVRALDFWPFGGAFFYQRSFQVGAERLSIGEIDDERLRMGTQDVRVHAALYRATRSGPPLRGELWAQLRLDDQLDDQMSDWVSDPVRGVRVEGGEAVFSSTFADYRRDFDQWTAGDDLCTLVFPYATDGLKTELHDLATRGCPHRFSLPDDALDQGSGSDSPALPR